jgi:SAM-dependent methyltransferase
MARRLRRWIVVAALAAAAIAAVAAAQAPYLPLVHGSTAGEIERMAAWLELRPGMQVADFGAGDGTFAVALARRAGASGLVYATEIDPELLAEIARAAREAGLANVKVVAGAAADTNLPERCCDAIFSRVVYHHLARPEPINAALLRALRPGGRLLVVDFEPGGLMDWIEGGGRHGGHGTPKDALVKEVGAAGFEVVRGPEPWRGRLYGVLFRRP